MNVLKQNILTQVNKSIQRINWDKNELRNLVDYIFSDPNPSLDGTKEILDSITEDLDRIKMLVQLLEK
tara:strand:- start:375 stop:578 length:204 start_codon:yes stop_codon:yes gene_type:complete